MGNHFDGIARQFVGIRRKLFGGSAVLKAFNVFI